MITKRRRPDEASSRDAIVPDFFVLGAPKAGTTTLYHQLRHHPQLEMTREKEPRILELAPELELASYEPLLPDHSAGVFLGEASPTYLFAPWVSERLRRLQPDAKLVAILRDPVQRAYSDWWMYYSKGIERRSFESAIEENLQRLSQGRRFDRPGTFDAWRRLVKGIEQDREIRTPMYVEMGYYADQLGRYLEYFDEDQLYVMFSSDLGGNPEATLKALFSFLNVDSGAPINLVDRKNEALGGVPAPIRWCYRASQRSGLVKILPAKIKALARRVSKVFDDRPPLPTAIGQKLRRHYEDHDRRLAHLLGRSLPWREDA